MECASVQFASRCASEASTRVYHCAVVRDDAVESLFIGAAARALHARANIGVRVECAGARCSSRCASEA
eukprot:9670118-Lingulodinium_polyedra.AAC.1